MLCLPPKQVPALRTLSRALRRHFRRMSRCWLSFGRAIGHELRGTGVTVTTVCPGPTTSEFAQIANMQGAAIFEGPMTVMTAAEVARQGMRRLRPGVRRSL